MFWACLECGDLADLTLNGVLCCFVHLEQAEMSRLSAEVAQQRPLWEQSKQLEAVRRAEVAEVGQPNSTMYSVMFSALARDMSPACQLVVTHSFFACWICFIL